MKKNVSLLLVLSLPLMILSSCANSTDSKWNYSRSDMSNFVSMEAALIDNGDSTSSFNLDLGVSFLKESLDKDDLIVYDRSKAAKVMEEKKKDYADYSVLKEASLDVSKIETPEEKDGFKVTFSSSDTADYGMLIHSSVISSDEYMMVSKYESEAVLYSDPQTEFEERYAKDKWSWNTGAKFAYQILSNIGMIFVGAAADSPTAIFSAVYSILGTLGDTFFGGGGTTIQDVMNQLKETDRKIDELSARLEKNTQQLASEIVRAETLVDQANLNTLDLAVNDFATNCLAPINNFNRNLADELGSFYRSFVKSSETINLLLSQGDDGKWRSASLMDLDDATTYNFSLTIADFVNAKAHLAEHSDIVVSGFMSELEKDIDSAVEAKSDLPEGIDKADLRGFIVSMIYDTFMKQYFSSSEDKAREYRNLIIELSERLLGASGKISILNTYLSRLQYMYNFASEIKSPIRSLTVNLLETLDMNAARACEACLFAKTNSEELEKDYKSAREAIQNLYKSVSELSDSYSFTTSAKLSGGFYTSEYDPSYSNPGNKCVLNVTFSADKVEMSNGSVKMTKDDMSKHSGISPTQHARIVARWNLLRASGAVDSKLDYAHYLSSVGVIPEASLDASSTLISLKKASSSSYRILTDDRNERELNSSDSSTILTCVAKGNPDGDYFELWKDYSYSRTHTSSYWYGKTYEGSFVDASSGVSLGTQKISTWARYAEDHWYWTDDEYWAFTSPSEGSYFFLVDIAS